MTNIGPKKRLGPVANIGHFLRSFISTRTKKYLLYGAQRNQLNYIWVSGCRVGILFDEWGKKCLTLGLRVNLFKPDTGLDFIYLMRRFTNNE